MKRVWLVWMAALSFLRADCVECGVPESRPSCGCQQHIQSDNMLTEAIEALQRGAFEEALAGFQMLAEQGNFIAQQNLAVMYQNGFGIAKNTKLAAYWFQKADENFRVHKSMQMQTLCPDGLREGYAAGNVVCQNSY